MTTYLAPTRSAPFTDEPGFYEPAGLWLYGNVRLLHNPLATVSEALKNPYPGTSELMHIESEAERLVLDRFTLVCGVHNLAQQRASTVPLRWGSPRIVVFSGGFHHHLGPDLDQEPFRVARLWRFSWDPLTDLAVSRRAPDKLPTFAHVNPTVDRLILELAQGKLKGLSSAFDSLTPVMRR